MLYHHVLCMQLAVRSRCRPDCHSSCTADQGHSAYPPEACTRFTALKPPLSPQISHTMLKYMSLPYTHHVGAACSNTLQFGSRCLDRSVPCQSQPVRLCQWVQAGKARLHARLQPVYKRNLAPRTSPRRHGTREGVPVAPRGLPCRMLPAPCRQR